MQLMQSRRRAKATSDSRWELSELGSGEGDERNDARGNYVGVGSVMEANPGTINGCTIYYVHQSYFEDNGP